MADTTGFGKRTGYIPRSPASSRKKAAEPPRFRPEAGPGVAAASADATRLKKNSDHFLWIGQLIGFVGLMVVFFSVLIWPSDPSQVRDLKGSIYVPPQLQGMLAFDDPAPYRESVAIGTTILDFGNPAVALIFFAGLVAIWTRQWIIAGLVLAFLFTPWGLFGYQIYGLAGILIVYAAVLALRLLPLPGWSIFILAPLLVVLGPTWLKPVADMLDDRLIVSKIEVEPYRRIYVAALVENGKTGPAGSGTRRVSTLVDLPAAKPAEVAGKAYLVAQELALRDDAAGADTALKKMEAAFTPNDFDRKRIETIRRYAIASNIEGPEARDRLLAEYRTQWIVAVATALIGTVLAFAGPFGRSLSRRVGARAARIERSASRIVEQNAVIDTDGVGFVSKIRSVAAIEGQAIASAMGRRIAIYRAAVAALCVAALFFVVGYHLFGLPDAASNTAFDGVALTGDSFRFLKGIGVPASEHFGDFRTQAIFAAPIIVGLLLFRRTTLALGAVALVILWALAAPILLDRQTSYDVAAASVGAGARQSLEGAIGNPDPAIGENGLDAFLHGDSRPTLPTIGPLTPSANIPTFESLRLPSAGSGPDSDAIAPAPDETSSDATGEHLDEVARLFPDLAKKDRQLAEARLKEFKWLVELTTGSPDTTMARPAPSIDGVPSIAVTPDQERDAMHRGLLRSMDKKGIDATRFGERPTDRGAGKISEASRVKRIDAEAKAKTAQKQAERKGKDSPDVAARIAQMVPEFALGGSHAAYTLAQIAYLEDRPEDAKRNLEQIEDRSAVGYYGHLQRLDLIRDWTAANGHPVSPDSSVGAAPQIMTEARLVSKLLLGFAIASTGLALLPLGAWLFAERRRRRIYDLVSQRGVMGVGADATPA